MRMLDTMEVSAVHGGGESFSCPDGYTATITVTTTYNADDTVTTTETFSCVAKSTSGGSILPPEEIDLQQ